MRRQSDDLSQLTTLPTKDEEPIVQRVSRHLIGRQTIKPGRAVLKGFMGLLLATSLVGVPLAQSITKADALAVTPGTSSRPLMTPVSQLSLRAALEQAEFDGREYVLNYLDGEELTRAAAHSVDLKALQAINPEFAFKFAEYMLRLDRLYPDDPVGPVVPEATDKSDTPEAVDPNAPATPEDPDATAPEDSETSEDPTVPGDTDDPTTPKDPEDPIDPDDPTADPDDPANPDDPATPEDPADPTTPEDPDQPSTPDDPATPEDPTTPDTPDTPEVPDVPQIEGDVQTPSNPEAETPEPGTGPVIADPEPSTPSQAEKSTNSGSSYPQWSYQGDTSYTPRHYTHDLTTEKFIAVIGEQARQIGQEQNLYASVMVAQAILESASGNSKLARAPHNNLFGIKGSFNGQSVSMSTLEDNGSGSMYSIVAPFRSYDSILESLDDYANLIRTGLNGYYRPVWKENAKTFVDACNYLEGHYATDTRYSEKLQDLIATYDLTRFDTPLDYEPVTPITVQVVDEETNRPLYDADGKPIYEERTLADLVAEATSHLGTDYLWGGTSPELGFDCSGLVQYSYSHALGINLPRTTYYQCLVGSDVNFSDLHMGDLLFFANGDDVHHVGMYLSDGYFIEAPRTGDVVKVTSLEEKMPTFAKRVVPTKAANTLTTGPLTILLTWPSDRLSIDA